MPQKFVLDPDMPVRGRDLVALGIDGHRLGLPLPSRERRAVVDDMLDAVDAPASPTRASANSRAASNSGS